MNIKELNVENVLKLLDYSPLPQNLEVYTNPNNGSINFYIKKNDTEYINVFYGGKTSPQKFTSFSFKSSSDISVIESWVRLGILKRIKFYEMFKGCKKKRKVG